MILLYGYICYYIFALIGISIGYHRYFTHRTFKTSKALEHVMLFFGLLCGGRSVLTWSAVHRMHHANSDTVDDPHSPVYKGVWNVILSRWSVQYIPKKYIKDLMKNQNVLFYHRYGKYLHLIVALVIFLISTDLFFIIIVCPYIFSWIGFGLLNWVAHKKGSPIDVPIMNLIAPGEGWHRYHHLHPQSYRLNKFDIAGWTIEKFFVKSEPSS